jgi:capsid assembly protease
VKVTGFAVACGMAWAIDEEWLSRILEIASRENPPTSEELGIIREQREQRQALEAATGETVDNTRNARRRGDVGILPVFGPLVPRADMFDEVSGATSLRSLSLDFNALLEHPGIGSILLHVSSPGGDVEGVSELAGMIYAARERKPVTAYISGLGASAAYWLASAANRVVVSPTAVVGSIGVVAIFRDTQLRDEKAGIRNLEFVSSQSPGKRPDPHTEAGKAAIQDRVDALASVFIADVATFRGVEPAEVLSRYGRGGVFVGQAAVEAGLVDDVGSFEGTLTALAESAVRRGSRPGQWTALTAREGDYERKHMNPLQQAWEGVTASFRKAGYPVEGTDAPEPPAAMVPAPPPAAAPLPDPRVAMLEAKLAEMETAQASLIQSQIEAEASAWVASVADRVTPAEAEKLRGLYCQAAQADNAHGTGLVATLKESVGARPVHHLTQELLHPGAAANAQVLPNPSVTRKDTDPPDAERMNALLALTPLGQAVLQNGKGN